LFLFIDNQPHNDIYLIFCLCHPISVKKGTVLSLVERVFKICSPEYIDSELLCLRDILFCNGYPVKLVNEIMKKRLIRHEKGNINESSQLLDTTISKRYVSLPYIPILGEKIKRTLLKHNIAACFRSVGPLSNFLNTKKTQRYDTQQFGNWSS